MKTIADQLRERHAAVVGEAQEIAGRAVAFERDLTETEQRKFDELVAEAQKIDERSKAIRDGEERAHDLENSFRKVTGREPTLGGVASPGDEEIARAFTSAIRAKNPAPIEFGADHLRGWYQPGLEQRDLLKTTATQGMGVSVWERVVMHMVENSAVLAAGATVATTGTGEDLQVPKSTAYSSAALIAEGASITESDATLAVSTLKAYKYAAFFQVSTELATDTPTDLLNFLARQAGEALALAYGPHLITGTGTGQPQGIVTGASVGKTGPTGTTVSLGTQSTAGQGTDVLYDLIGSLAEPYSRQPSTGFVLANSSLAIARKLKDSSGQPVAGMVGGGLNAAVSGAPSGNNVVLGYPAYVDPNVAAMTANAKSICFGDFSRYFVRIVNGIRFERSDEYAFQNDLVSFRAIIRLDGALVDANGIKLFQNSAT